MLSLLENVFVKKNPLQDLLSSLNLVISTNEMNRILTGHMIFKLLYNQIYQLKTTHMSIQGLSYRSGIQNKIYTQISCIVYLTHRLQKLKRM